MSAGTRTRSLRVGDEWARVEAVAEATGRTASDIIRKLIMENLPRASEVGGPGFCPGCLETYNGAAGLKAHQRGAHAAHPCRPGVSGPPRPTGSGV